MALAGHLQKLLPFKVKTEEKMEDMSAVDSKTDLVCFSLVPGLMSMSRGSPYPPTLFPLPVPKVPGSGLRKNFKRMRIGVLLHHFQPLSKASVFGLWTHPSREEGKYQGVIYYTKLARGRKHLFLPSGATLG